MDETRNRTGRTAEQHAVLDEIQSWVARRAPGRADIQRFEMEQVGLVELVAQPAAAGPSAIDVIACKSEIILEIGRAGARWELTYGEKDVGLARCIIEAVVGGCTVERSGWPRTAARVTQDDGVVLTDASLLPLLSQGGWRGRRRMTRYEPY